LKDWIKKDTSVPKHVRDGVEKYINCNECLRYCADIANGTKHLDLDPNHNRRISQNILKGPRKLFFDIAIGKSETTIKEEYCFW
jgi:hypothetical protein